VRTLLLLHWEALPLVLVSVRKPQQFDALTFGRYENDKLIDAAL
jgi:hypothetical protein